MLTNNQKNYIALFLLEGPALENELRMFLAKSGWDIASIDAAVAYSTSADLQKSVLSTTLSEPLTPSSQSFTPTKVIVNEAIHSVIPTIGKPVSDAYTEIVPNVTGNTTLAAPAPVLKATIAGTPDISHLEQLDGLSAYHKQDLSNLSTPQSSQRSAMSDIVPVSVMPQAPVAIPGGTSKVLHFIIWLLAVVLIALVAAVLGYMYYTGTGIFNNLTYIKL